MEKTEASKKFEKYLKSIGGLENGWRSSPNMHSQKWQYRMFNICKFLGWGDKNNPYRARIYDRGFCEVSDGWLPLIQEMIQGMIEQKWDKQVNQIKEKFGGLRFYINNGSNEVYNVIHWGEEKSYTICETCGSKEDVAQTKGGWITTLCGVHRALKEKEKLNKN